MIDFRYHVVSLVSVFIALAVGIVLGAGPLKDSIGTTLAQQVDQLRSEKDGLRSDLLTANSSLSHRDTFVSDIAPAAITGQLTGRAVVVVSLPGVDGDAVSPTVDAIGTAGGTVTGQVTISSDWTAASKATDRSTLAANLAESVPVASGGGSAAEGDTDTQLARFLSDALVSVSGTTGQAGRGNTTSANVVKRFTDAKLISVKGDLSLLAGAALVVAPEVATTSTDVKPTSTTDDTTTWVTLADALDSAGGGAVVTGPSSSATTGGVIAAVRKTGPTNTRVSTVDTGSTPMGVITAVLALREQLSGGVGQYGFGDGAKDVLPAIPAVTTTIKP